MPVDGIIVAIDVEDGQYILRYRDDLDLNQVMALLYWHAMEIYKQSAMPVSVPKELLN